MATARKLPELPPRAASAHKGDFGRVLVVAGARGMAGAAALAGDAALRSGAGLVTLAVPRSLYPIVAVKVTCCTTHPLPETAAGTLSERAAGTLLDLAQGFDVVALGPGLGRHPGTWRLARRLAAELGKPTVIDADALNALAEAPECLRAAPAPRVLTPHPGEMARLAHSTADEVQTARRKVAAGFARRYRAVVLLKGHGTVVTDGARVRINATGNPGMATGGAGDVLTGVIAALIAQGLSPFDAALLGAHVHGLAGDLAVKEFGQVSLIATDILNALPTAFKRCGAR
jgi:NAD(P)H-hydrate epimerase